MREIYVKGPKYTFKTAALLDSRIVPLLPPHFVAPSPSPMDMFDIRSSSGQGLGMFALKDIPTGGLILTEHPSVVTPALLRPNNFSSSLYSSVFSLLDKSEVAQLLALADGQPHGICRSKEEAIVRTNNIGIDLPAPDAMAELPGFTLHGAVFLSASRCNHRYDQKGSQSSF
jgi:hypothetical protein